MEGLAHGEARFAIVLWQLTPRAVRPLQRHRRLPQLGVCGSPQPPGQHRCHRPGLVEMRDRPPACGNLRLEQVQAPKQLIVVTIAVLDAAHLEVVDPVDGVVRALDLLPLELPFLSLFIEFGRARRRGDTRARGGCSLNSQRGLGRRGLCRARGRCARRLGCFDRIAHAVRRRAPGDQNQRDRGGGCLKTHRMHWCSCAPRHAGFSRS